MSLLLFVRRDWATILLKSAIVVTLAVPLLVITEPGVGRAAAHDGRSLAGVNLAGVKFYHDLIDELKAHGIEPYVTLYHWDLPQALQKPTLRGWLDRSIVPLFRAFAELCFRKGAWNYEKIQRLTELERLRVLLADSLEGQLRSEFFASVETVIRDLRAREDRPPSACAKMGTQSFGSTRRFCASCGRSTQRGRTTP